MKKVVIIGGGISGLTAGYLFANSGKYEVHIVEKSDKLGGLLKSFDYGKYGYFDYGAHNILETKIEELDTFYYNLLPKEKWQTTTINGQRRALTGLMYNKKLQENSPFIDLLENEKLPEYISDFFQNIDNKTFEDIYKKDAYTYAIYLFGKKISDDIIVPAIKKLYKRHPRELNTMVLFLTQFTRIGLFEETVMDELVHTQNIGSRLSFTNQLNLPIQYLTDCNSWYPKEYGIYRVIDAIEKKLLEKGVTFHKNSTVSSICTDNSKIEKIFINKEEHSIDELVCSVGNYPLGLLLNMDMSSYNFDKNPQTIITNVLIDRPLTCGELSFIYSYDNGTRIFRIDNYINYCEGAKSNGLYRVSIESIEFEDFDKKEFQDKLISELIDYKIMPKETVVSFIETEILANGFPLLTQNNISVVNDLRDKIDKLQISNLTNIGILSEEGLFFESDVVKDTYKKIRKIIKEGESDYETK
jgi:protoporphyrinogen oxidase